MNIQSIIALGIALAVSACARPPTPIQTPMLITGIVSKPEFIDWYRDYCSAGQLVDFPPSRGDCLSHGGEIYKVKLLKPQDIYGNSLGKELIIAYPAHALNADYVWPRTSLFLVSAPADFSDKTGIFLYTPTYGVYDKRNQCVTIDEYAHTDGRFCSDASFHKANEGKCISVEAYLSHYGHRP